MADKILHRKHDEGEEEEEGTLENPINIFDEEETKTESDVPDEDMWVFKQVNEPSERTTSVNAGFQYLHNYAHLLPGNTTIAIEGKEGKKNCQFVMFNYLSVKDMKNAFIEFGQGSHLPDKYRHKDDDRKDQGTQVN